MEDLAGVPGTVVGGDGADTWLGPITGRSASVTTCSRAAVLRPKKLCETREWAAEQRGVRAKMYLEEGAPEAALDLARKILGNANVHAFTR